MAKELNLKGGESKDLFMWEGLEGQWTKTSGTKPEIVLRILGFLGLPALSKLPPNLVFLQ